MKSLQGLPTIELSAYGQGGAHRWHGARLAIWINIAAPMEPLFEGFEPRNRVAGVQ
ncbi:MAG: hypothetical protein ACR2OW_03870 [Methyloligellaceae bacterium]